MMSEQRSEPPAESHAQLGTQLAITAAPERVRVKFYGPFEDTSKAEPVDAEIDEGPTLHSKPTPSESTDTTIDAEASLDSVVDGLRGVQDEVRIGTTATAAGALATEAALQGLRTATGRVESTLRAGQRSTSTGLDSIRESLETTAQATSEEIGSVRESVNGLTEEVQRGLVDDAARHEALLAATERVATATEALHERLAPPQPVTELPEAPSSSDVPYTDESLSSIELGETVDDQRIGSLLQTILQFANKNVGQLPPDLIVNQIKKGSIRYEDWETGRIVSTDALTSLVVTAIHELTRPQYKKALDIEHTSHERVAEILEQETLSDEDIRYLATIKPGPSIKTLPFSLSSGQGNIQRLETALEVLGNAKPSESLRTAYEVALGRPREAREQNPAPSLDDELANLRQASRNLGTRINNGTKQFHAWAPKLRSGIARILPENTVRQTEMTALYPLITSLLCEIRSLRLGE
jgi:hypothetical protein